jgi:hypothetical protein
MNLLLEYDFDALPYLDNEYDHPDIQNMVHSLIAAEMRTFTPRSDYLSHLPCPQSNLAARSSILQNEMDRMERQIPMEKLDMTRYNVDQPQGQMYKDVQSWRKTVASAKIQLEYQNNRLMNLELLDVHGASLWRHHNQAMEGVQNQVDLTVQGVKRKSDELNSLRKHEQEEVRPALMNMNRKSDETLMKAWVIKQSCDNIENYKKQKM